MELFYLVVFLFMISFGFLEQMVNESFFYFDKLSFCFVLVMITVAKSFDAPIKLIFPQDLLENGLLAANKFAMLGLGMFLGCNQT
jgi:hypothetical protein